MSTTQGSPPDDSVKRAEGETPPQQPAPLVGLVQGIADAAAIWVGLAFFATGLAFDLAPFWRVLFLALGGGLVAGGIAYALGSRPEHVA